MWGIGKPRERKVRVVLNLTTPYVEIESTENTMQEVCVAVDAFAQKFVSGAQKKVENQHSTIT